MGSRLMREPPRAHMQQEEVLKEGFVLLRKVVPDEFADTVTDFLNALMLLHESLSMVIRSVCFCHYDITCQ